VRRCGAGALDGAAGKQKSVVGSDPDSAVLGSLSFVCTYCTESGSLRVAT
jgi:hypothetical protein